MTNRNEWRSLAQKCRDAKGPDPKIDAEIFLLACGGIFWREIWSGLFTESASGATPAPFTEAYGAIVLLIKKSMPEKDWSLSEVDRQGVGQVDAMCSETAATPVLALCAAYCAARSYYKKPQYLNGLH